MAGIPIEDKQISPTVLVCLHQTEGMQMPEGARYTHRLVTDYEMEFFTDSRGGRLLIDGKSYEVNKGDVIFKRPGVTSQGILPYTCYLVCFDLLGRPRAGALPYYLLDEKPLQPSYSCGLLDMLPTLIRPADSGKIGHWFGKVHAAFTGSDPHAGLLLRAYVLQILHQLHLEATDLRGDAIVPSSPHRRALQEVCGHIDTHLQDKLDLPLLARIAGISPAYFQKLFKQACGESPAQYVVRKRLEAARSALSRTDRPIAAIARDCGFEELPYFSYCFKKHVGVSPSQYRRSRRYE